MERHSTERATVRSVPLSRLTKAQVDPYVQAVMIQKPEEVFVSLPANAESDDNTPHIQFRRQLSAGVPVFDERNEEPFGFVMIECDLQRILEGETRNRLRAAQQVIALDPNGSIWVHHSQPHGPIEESVGRKAADLIPGIDDILEVVASRTEFVDDTNREIYANRLELAKGEPGLVFVFLQKPFQA